MNSRRPKKKLIGPWRSLHGLIWVAGIFYLISINAIWPGILVLFAISAIYEGLLQAFLPAAYEEEAPATTESQAAMPAQPPTQITPPPQPAHRIDLLPPMCPNCNGPIRGSEVKWTGPQTADCPYCGTNLPMTKA